MRPAFLFFAAWVLHAQAPTELYHLVFLRPDPARKPLAKEEGQRIQTAHMANIGAMYDRGFLIAAGPFDDTPTTISGIFVFKTESLAEARKVAAEDPTVVEHRNRADVYGWLGPAGLGDEYRRLHTADPKTPEGMGVQPFFLLYRAAGAAAVPAEAHAAYLARLRGEGKLATSGPIRGEDDLAEILIFNRIPDSEAARIVAEDPAVKSGAYRAEPHRWWCAEHVLPK